MADNQTFETSLPKLSRSIPVAIPAGTLLNGQVQPSMVQVAAAGDQFYVRVASAIISIQPVRAANVGTSNPFGNAQGQKVAGGFETLTVSNFNLFPVVALVWVGFEAFINNQLVLANDTLKIAFPTYPVTNSAPIVNITDLSGSKFADINGKKWFAVSRFAILIGNLDANATHYLRPAGAAGTESGAPAIFPIYPSPSPLQFQVSGDYSVNLGGANINMIISEIYNAFAA